MKSTTIECTLCGVVKYQKIDKGDKNLIFTVEEGDVFRLCPLCAKKLDPEHLEGSWIKVVWA
jgi:hypothetical protein